MRQVEHRHTAGLGAAGLGTAQSWFWSRHKAGFGAVGLGSAQSRFWSRYKAGFGAVGLGSAQSRFWSRHNAGFWAIGLGSAQSRFWSRHKSGFGAVGLGSAHSRFRVGTKPVLEQAQSRFGCGSLQNRFSIKTGFASSIEATKLDLSQNGSMPNLHIYSKWKGRFSADANRFSCGRLSVGTQPVWVQQV